MRLEVVPARLSQHRARLAGRSSSPSASLESRLPAIPRVFERRRTSHVGDARSAWNLDLRVREGTITTRSGTAFANGASRAVRPGKSCLSRATPVSSCALHCGHGNSPKPGSALPSAMPSDRRHANQRSSARLSLGPPFRAGFDPRRGAVGPRRRHHRRRQGIEHQSGHPPKPLTLPVRMPAGGVQPALMHRPPGNRGDNPSRLWPNEEIEHYPPCSSSSAA